MWPVTIETTVSHYTKYRSLARGLVMQMLVPCMLTLSLFADTTLADELGFGGLNLKTTAEELKKRYPKSPMVGNYMYLSDAESHDHIYGIEIPDGNSGGRLRLIFERRQILGARRNPRYPSCQQVLLLIQGKYGVPGKVEEFAEESSFNRRFSWTKKRELLALHCFSSNKKNFQAEALTITDSAR
jgi:hypothetical protein